jgi:hypothetical protein
MKTNNPIQTEKKRNTFEISEGNKKVLELIPSMMEDESFRDELRKLALEFITKDTLRHIRRIKR